MRIARHGEETVVALGFTLAILLDLYNANHAAGQNDTGKRCGFMQHHDVDRVAVLGFCRGYETPVMC